MANTATTWKEVRFSTHPSTSGGGGIFFYNDPDRTLGQIKGNGFFDEGAGDYVRTQTPKMWDGSANATGGCTGVITGSDGMEIVTFYWTGTEVRARGAAFIAT